MLDEPNGVAEAETDARQGMVLNIMVGSVGALLAGLRRAPCPGWAPFIGTIAGWPRWAAHDWEP